ncbi:TPA: hypothetical protein ACOEHG_004840 [Enterobacter ludwigii]
MKNSHLQRWSGRCLKQLLAGGLLLTAAALTASCSAVSYTRATGAQGQSLTNAEVQPGNTVVLTYPNGSACIDTHPGDSHACKKS